LLAGRYVLGGGVVVYEVDPEPWGFTGVTSAYIVSRGGRGFVVDPGFQYTYTRVLEAAAALGVRIEGVVVTHVHLDHGGGAAALSHATGAPVYVHPRGARHVAWPGKLFEAACRVVGPDAAASGAPLSLDPELVVATRDGACYIIGGVEACFHHTPGHASHHQVVSVEGAVFTGDAMGLRYGPCYVPSTPPPLHLDEYVESVVSIVAGLRPRLLLYTHHGASREPGRAAAALLAELARWASCSSLGELLERSRCASLVYEELRDVPYFRGEVERSLEGIRLAVTRRG